MDLGSPLVTLMNPLEARALRTLARTHAELTGRQIHRLVGAGSVGGVTNALTRLASSGLVTAIPKPYATLYRGNRDHLLWPAVELILNSASELRRRIRNLAMEHGPEGVTVALYGSVERGTATAQSDVDLLVVMPSSADTTARQNFTELLRSNVETWTGNPAQVIPISVQDLAESTNRGDALVETWLTDSEVLVGSLQQGDPR